ncbi:MAG: Fe-S-cluster containining protein [Desulforhopalus sp.]
MSEICKRCAECCKNFPFVELSNNDIDSLIKATGLPVDAFTYAKGKAVEEYFLKFQDNGYCFFLNEKNGIFSCNVYEARPSICKNYPSKCSQKEVCNKHREKFLSDVGD